MEFIKKKIFRIMTTGTTTGCTGNSYVIIPDTGVTYNFNFLLTQQNKDFGFFDVYIDPLATGVTGGTYISSIPYIITGSSTSRLEELRKYSVSTDLSKKYFTSSNSNEDGLDLTKTISGVSYIYYLGGIIYTDSFLNNPTGITTFSFVSSGYSSQNFINLPIIKDEDKENIIEMPLIGNNVFIIRNEQSILEYNYRLRNIHNLSEIEYYAGGAFYNIIKNT